MRLQADDISCVNPGEQPASAGQVAVTGFGNRGWRCGRRSRVPACLAGRFRDRPPSECGRCQNRLRPDSRRREPGATASGTVVTLSVKARGLVAKNSRALSAEGSEKVFHGRVEEDSYRPINDSRIRAAIAESAGRAGWCRGRGLPAYSESRDSRARQPGTAP